MRDCLGNRKWSILADFIWCSLPPDSVWTCYLSFPTCAPGKTCLLIAWLPTQRQTSNFPWMKHILFLPAQCVKGKRIGGGAVNCSQVDRWCRRHRDVCFLWRVQCWAGSIDSTGDVWGTVLGRWCRQHRGCLWSVESTMVTETVQLSHCELNCLRVNVT